MTSSPSAKLEELLRILRDVRLRRGKAAILCETDGALQHLRRHLLRMRVPCLYVSGDAPKSVRLRQLARFARSPAGSGGPGSCCLLAGSSVSPDGITAIGAAEDLTTVVFYDCPSELSQVGSDNSHSLFSKRMTSMIGVD